MGFNARTVTLAVMLTAATVTMGACGSDSETGNGPGSAAASGDSTVEAGEADSKAIGECGGPAVKNPTIADADFYYNFENAERFQSESDGNALYFTEERIQEVLTAMPANGMARFFDAICETFAPSNRNLYIEPDMTEAEQIEVIRTKTIFNEGVSTCFLMKPLVGTTTLEQEREKVASLVASVPEDQQEFIRGSGDLNLKAYELAGEYLCPQWNLE